MPFGKIKVCQMRLRFRKPQLLAAGNVEDLASESTIAQQRVDVVIAGEEPLFLLLPIESGAVLVERGIDLIRVAVEGRVPTIERDAAGGGVDTEEGRHMGHGQRPSAIQRPPEE